MTFQESIKICFQKYAEFSGRASRSEFWWFVLFTFLVCAGLTIVDPTQMLARLASLLFLLPLTAAGVRRLHDRDRSGWFMLFNLIPILNLVLIFFYAQKGTEGANRYG